MQYCIDQLTELLQLSPKQWSFDMSFQSQEWLNFTHTKSLKHNKGNVAFLSCLFSLSNSDWGEVVPVNPSVLSVKINQCSLSVLA